MDTEYLSGNFWSARKIESSYLISIKDHANLREALTDFVVSQQIETAQIFGVVMIKGPLIRFKTPGSQKYFNIKMDTQKSEASISGNIQSTLAGPVFDLNVIIEDENNSSWTGHLNDAEVINKGEFLLHPLSSRILYFRRKEDDFFLS
ncbi:DUF296 domain-containing protein [Chryseobacterium sp. MYb264]|uniref:PCC domain-containing protein n=1 Tax=Chryseobacterium sp. MYb264 TaxID=2745153 RepID=UPI002E0EDE5C|nr:DUF296 domain-containing protein [Chryseobacterium sp. MYb264]